MDFTAVHVHFHDLQPFCNSLKISNQIIKTAKKELSNDYYFKVTISFQCLTTIRYGEQGIGWAWRGAARVRGGGGGAGGLDHIGKSHVIWVDLDLLQPLTKFPGSAHGGGGNLFHALEQYQARG